MKRECGGRRGGGVNERSVALSVRMNQVMQPCKQQLALKDRRNGRPPDGGRGRPRFAFGPKYTHRDWERHSTTNIYSVSLCVFLSLILLSVWNKSMAYTHWLENLLMQRRTVAVLGHCGVKHLKDGLRRTACHALVAHADLDELLHVARTEREVLHACCHCQQMMVMMMILCCRCCCSCRRQWTMRQTGGGEGLRRTAPVPWLLWSWIACKM